MAAYSVDEVDNKTKAFRASVSNTAADSESAAKVSKSLLLPLFGGYQLNGASVKFSICTVFSEGVRRCAPN